MSVYATAIQINTSQAISYCRGETSEEETRFNSNTAILLVAQQQLSGEED